MLAHLAALTPALTSCDPSDEKSASLVPPDHELFAPSVPYPRWDSDWDGRKAISASRADGITRHLILVRHGQYDESSKVVLLAVALPSRCLLIRKMKRGS